MNVFYCATRPFNGCTDIETHVRRGNHFLENRALSEQLLLVTNESDQRTTSPLSSWEKEDEKGLK